ncbi:hypothetical protein GCM10022403_080430 [Streptomyces coacervatus]|uniref:Roadblock/LC7 domain-containing protein n=1 Tax=Streptomyces coacervatus TaxID=647381 RepID=A0ABP7J7D2_9ACTN|nr:hypothetical protein [Streptomyces coacervatus]MDF2269421.1 hypothetical protein [Streptomyces coacervatus]
MPDTVHALLVATDGTITDLQVSTNDNSQRAQIQQALGDYAEALRYVRRPDGSHTVALAAETRDGQPPNLCAAIALHFLLGESLIADIQGPVIFVGFNRQGALTSLTEDAVRTIRTASAIPAVR